MQLGRRLFSKNQVRRLERLFDTKSRHQEISIMSLEIQYGIKETGMTGGKVLGQLQWIPTIKKTEFFHLGLQFLHFQVIYLKCT